MTEARVYKRERELPLPRPGVFLVSRITQSLSACAATRILRFFEVDWSVGRWIDTLHLAFTFVIASAV